MTAFVLSGLMLGLSGGLSPGPLLALVASESLRHGVGAGIKIALAPLLTDLPIILATLLVLEPLSDQRLPLALVHLGGGLYLAWLGWQGVRFQGARLRPLDPDGALRRGVIANFFNPSPYLFWLAVGAPTLLAAWRHGRLTAAAFIAAFYLMLVGSKVLLALALGRTRRLLHSGLYIAVMRGLGVLLLAYAAVFFHQSWRLLDRVANAF
ncbi:MAG TPA: LysE family transporter [Candidatus Competibacter sp.]|nr:LysE family transporter [Candidatus Competibacter sp.]HUM93526.1 LysE family transporter [Candidatus Competibacter sp.]